MSWRGLTLALRRRGWHHFAGQRIGRLPIHRGTASSDYSTDQASNGTGQCPSQAQVVICGGGSIGCSIAYHLPKVGFKDVLLLEQGSLGCGTTWHSAALIGVMRSSLPQTRITRYGSELYPQLEEETGAATGWKNCGGVILARNKERLWYLRRLQSIGRVAGVESELISPREVLQLPGCSMVRTDDILAGLWVPNDGVINSTDLCQSFVKGAKQQGVQVVEKVCVEGVEVENGRVCGVKTDKGHVKCEVFINAAGQVAVRIGERERDCVHLILTYDSMQWARQLGQLSIPSVSIPLHASEHFYIITKPSEDISVDPMMPTVRDYDGYLYAREWSGGMLIGAFEPNAKPCFQDGIPKPFEFQLLPEDWDHFEMIMEQILHRFPDLKKAEIRQMVNGPESFTPDNGYLLGEAPEIKKYYVAAGLNSTGIVGGAGVGKAMAEWIAGDSPPSDLWSFDISRFPPHFSNNLFLSDRISESVGRVYRLPYPGWEWETGKGVKMSPLHSRLEKAGARWGQTVGWERAKWFAKSEDEPQNNTTFGKPVWFEQVGEEHRACREKVVLFDLTSFAKFDIQGPDAESALQKLCTNNVAVPVGKIVYTGMLNQHGGYVTDCTVTRLAQDKYLATCPTDHVTHDAAWISRHLPPSTSLSDVTGRYSVLALMGPRARDVLQRVTKTPLDNEHFPFSTAQVIDVGFASGVRALRISYVGELGWELFVPTEFACGVYDQLMAVGGEYGLSNAGMYAFNNLRLEKGYRHCGHDIDTETTPWEAGLGFAVDMNKGDFIGRGALEQQKKVGLSKMVVSFLVDTKGNEDLFPWGHENIYRNGELVGYVTSAAFGYSVGGHVCMGFVYRAGDSSKTVDSGFVKEGEYEIEIDGERCPARVSLTPFYDPKSLRVKM